MALFVCPRQISETIPLEVACFCKSQTDLIDRTLEVACFCKSQTDLTGRTLEVACFCKSQTDLIDMTFWLLKWHAFVSLRQISQAGLLKWHAFVSLRPISETGLSKWHTFVSPRQISEGGLLQQNVFSSFRHHLIFHAGPLEVAYFCNPQIDLRGRFVTTDCIF